jgi:hypothetical protein
MMEKREKAGNRFCHVKLAKKYEYFTDLL